MLIGVSKHSQVPRLLQLFFVRSLLGYRGILKALLSQTLVSEIE